MWFGVAAVKQSGLRVIPASFLTRLGLALVPDGRRAPLPPDAGKPVETYRETLAALLGWVAGGRLHPIVAERIPLADAVRAHELLERGGHAGKVVLVPGE